MSEDADAEDAKLELRRFCLEHIPESSKIAVVGPPRSGRGTLMRHIAQSLRSRFAEARCVAATASLRRHVDGCMDVAHAASAWDDAATVAFLGRPGAAKLLLLDAPANPRSARKSRVFEALSGEFAGLYSTVLFKADTGAPLAWLRGLAEYAFIFFDCHVAAQKTVFRELCGFFGSCASFVHVYRSVAGEAHRCLVVDLGAANRSRPLAQRLAWYAVQGTPRTFFIGARPREHADEDEADAAPHRAAKRRAADAGDEDVPLEVPRPGKPRKRPAA